MAAWGLQLLMGALWASTGGGAYFADWSSLGGRPSEPTCVDIPRDMTLCSDIGYDKMRLPNLLDHDTLAEAQQQAGSWVPLLNVRCHPDTKLFLCSLFTPVCLENEIFPCRSLCQAVRSGCEARMRTYGYDWPAMLSCERFPQDNDMCIKSFDGQKNQVTHKDDFCPVCSPAETYENIMDNYCRSDFAIIGRIKKQRGTRVKHRNVKILKSTKGKKFVLRRSKMVLEGESACCSFVPGKQKYLIMGTQEDSILSPTFVLPWRKTKTLRKSMKNFNDLNCKDPKLFPSAAKGGGGTEPGEPTGSQDPETPKSEEAKRKSRRRGRRRKNKNGARNKKEKKENRKNNRNRRRKNRNKKKNDKSDSLT